MAMVQRSKLGAALGSEGLIFNLMLAVEKYERKGEPKS